LQVDDHSTWKNTLFQFKVLDLGTWQLNVISSKFNNSELQLKAPSRNATNLRAAWNQMSCCHWRALLFIDERFWAQ